MRISTTAGGVQDLPVSDGNVYYVRGGLVVARKRVAPTQVKTPPRSIEVGGMVGAARAWAYALSAVEQDEWRACLVDGLDGIGLWWWIWSLLTSGGVEPTVSGTACVAAVELDEELKEQLRSLGYLGD